MARKNRAPPFSYRPTVADRDAVIAAWRASGKSFSAFLTEAILRRPASRARRKPALDQELAAVLLAQAAAIAGRLAAVPQGATEREEALRACREELLLIRTFLMQLAGRDP